MGDIFSKKTQSTDASVRNNQIAQNAGGVALSGGVSNLSAGQNLHIEIGSNEVALAAIAASHRDVEQALANTQNVQHRASDSIDAAVQAAQQTALAATPVQPADYAAVVGEQQLHLVLAVTGIAAVAVILIVLLKRT